MTARPVIVLCNQALPLPPKSFAPGNGKSGKELVGIRDVQEPESELSKFFRSRIGLGVKFNVKTGAGVGAGVTIF